MENMRLALLFSLAAILFLIYSAWQQDYGAAPSYQSSKTTDLSSADKRSSSTAAGDIPTVPAPVVEGGPQKAVVPTSQSTAAPTITVETDVLKLEISTRGGSIVSAWLRDYSVTPDQPDAKFRLLKADVPNLFVAQFGLVGTNEDVVPNHDAIFTADSDHFQLGPDQKSLTVDLLWNNPTGIIVRKSLTLTAGSYVIQTTQEVTNNTGMPLTVTEYSQLQRTALQDPNASRFVNTYTGAAYYSPEDKYKKVSFSDMQAQKLDRSVTGGWVAMIQHYFMAAWIPPRGTEEVFYTNVLDGSRFIIGNYSAPASLAPGASHSFSNEIFVGPQLAETLDKIAPGLDLTIDYGWLTVIAKPIHWLLDKIHDVVGNWGWSIIVLTIIIKLAFYKLSETSYKSMANMRQLTPRMQALKDRYGDDKERLNQAMMELYKTEKINPLGGCLPILVQIPVFIALYWVLLQSVELRHAPFIFWIDNLSAPDPFFVLPVIMGVSMFIQSKLNPAPPDPIQAKVMMSLPFVFTVFFAFFPSGLVLYWTVNNILSIAQQWHITRNIEKAAAKRKR